MPRPRAIMGVRIRSERDTMAKEPSAAEREAAAAAAALIAGSRERWSKALAAVEASFGIRPDEGLVASEIRRWCELFDPKAHRALLRRKRLAAAAVMEALADWNPVLTGHVLSGAATADTAVTIAVRTDDEKGVELTLLSLGVDFDVLDAAGEGRQASVSLLTECRKENVIISIASSFPSGKTLPPDEWQHPLEARSRIALPALRELLEAYPAED